MKGKAVRLAKPLIRHAVDTIDRLLGIREFLAEDPREQGCMTLDGDRAIEWSFVVSNLPRCSAKILDVGCVQSALTGIAARLGHDVTGMDLQDIEYSMDRVTFIHGDVATVPLPFETFDLIIACSSIEHIGIEGRYGSTKLVDGDLAVMRRLAHSLAPQGRLVLTVPVGRDAVFKPVHRVYGETRLPMLLRGYSVLCEEYWAKEVDNRWHCCSAVRALQVQGSPQFYALGCFVLFPSRSES